MIRAIWELKLPTIMFYQPQIWWTPDATMGIRGTYLWAHCLLTG